MKEQCVTLSVHCLGRCPGCRGCSSDLKSLRKLITYHCCVPVQLKCALQKRGERDASRVHSGGVNAALVSQDGRLAVTLSKDCTARVWDLETGTCRHVLVGGSSCQELSLQLCSFAFLGSHCYLYVWCPA